MKFYKKIYPLYLIVFFWVTAIFAQAPDTLWTRTYGGPDPFCDDFGNSVQQTIDGGYIIAGYTQLVDTNQGDVWLLKTDAEGDTATGIRFIQDSLASEGQVHHFVYIFVCLSWQTDHEVEFQLLYAMTRHLIHGF